MPMVPSISIASAVTIDWLPYLYILMNSIKDNKQPTTVVHYYVIVPFSRKRGNDWYMDYFKDIPDNNFLVHIVDAAWFTDRINNPNGTKMHYIRCLFPKYFTHHERILWLDSDIVCIGQGIEELWDTPVDDVYAGVVADPPVWYTAEFEFERHMSGTSEYFNSGVMLMNLTKMRADGMDEHLASFCRFWDKEQVQPTTYDQTLFNYLFKGRVKWMPLRFNNQFMTAYSYKIAAFDKAAQAEGYDDALDTLDDTVLLHFCDQGKPYATHLDFPESTYPYLEEARRIWKDAEAQYGRKEEGEPATIHIVSIITEDLRYLLYILMGSIKANKKANTTIEYTVLIPGEYPDGLTPHQDFFADIEDDTFHVHVMDANEPLARVGDLPGNRIAYVRCLLPSILPDLKKVLYLDADVLCYRPGIEDLWNIETAGQYVVASLDGPVTYAERYADERENVGTDLYFNSGVMVLNLDYLRRTGKAEELENWCAHWDQSHVKCILHHDQTILNYLLKDKVWFASSIYNNLVLTTWGYRIKAQEKQAYYEGYAYPLDMLEDTVFFHFCDRNRPWLAEQPQPDDTYPYLKEAREIWNRAVGKYAKRVLRKPQSSAPDPDAILIATTATYDRANNVYILLNSLKQNMRPDTRINFYLFVPKTEINDFQQYLTGIPDESFRVTIMDVDWFADKVDTKGTIRNHLYYARCLFPQVFLNQDKLLYMDIDMVCVGPGIEDLWNTDIEGYWIGAVIDPTWQYCPYFKHDPQNIGTDHYINNGMMLMNFKQIREDGKDKEFAEWCLHWDQSKLLCHCFDQTLCNYILKDKIKLLPFKYNNSVLATLGIAQDYYQYHLNQCGYVEPLDSLQHAVLLHFCGSKKPWDAKALACGPDEYPYKEEAVELWQQLVRKYGPETDDEDDIQEDFGLTLSVQTPAWYVYDG